eukprot:jgi/Tetstr1/461266/TSEL_006393.t1
MPNLASDTLGSVKIGGSLLEATKRTVDTPAQEGRLPSEQAAVVARGGRSGGRGNSGGRGEGRGGGKPSRSVALVAEAAPPSPDRIDLSAGAPPPSRETLWRGVKEWIVFSDLHVCAASLETSLAVLRTVKREAAARGAGVLFLGDFWHHRGSLPVEPLNAVLDEFAGWSAPTLMLVGNHDQVTAGGMLHALAPLQHCAPCIHVFEQPSLFMGALWLPYRADPRKLSDAVAAAGDVAAIFAHVDVVGAYMNETFQARDGVKPELFPAAVPVFTGHYHRRHTVEGTAIHYVGSPYQVSRSEAGQAKALTVLDASWRPVGEIAMDAGPRHFLLAGAAGVPGAAERPAVRPGDKVRFQLENETPSAEEQEVIDGLVAEGAKVEVVATPVAAAARITEAEHLGAIPLFHAYAEATELSREASAAAVAILQGLEGVGASPQLELQLDSMRIAGFGPFAAPVEYQLKGRGLQVLVGRNLDDEAADSNGAGKTALAMAPLWVLTGKLDGGRDGGGGRAATHADVVSDTVKSASGRVEGLVNGKPFFVERAVTRRALTKLHFSVDGEDKTQADSRMTQALIDQELGTPLLMRTAFFNQNAAALLLDAGDKEFKAELAKVVDLDIWEAAKERAADMLKGRKQSMANVEGQRNAAASMLGRLRDQIDESAQRYDEWEAAHVRQRREVAGEMEARAGDLLGAVAAALDVAHGLERFAAGDERRLGTETARDAQEPGRQQPGGDAEMERARARIAELRAEEAQLTTGSRDVKARCDAMAQLLREAEILAAQKKGAAHIAEGQLEEYAAMKAAPVRSGGEAALGHSHQSGDNLVCDRCLQTISAPQFEANYARLEAELHAAWDNSDAAADEAARLRESASRLGGQLDALGRRLDEVRRIGQAAHDDLRRAQDQQLHRAVTEEREAAKAAGLQSSCQDMSAQMRRAIGSITAALQDGQHAAGLEDAVAAAEARAETARGDDAAALDADQAQRLQQEGRQLLMTVEQLLGALARQKQQLAQAEATSNPFLMELTRLRDLCQETERNLEVNAAELAAIELEIKHLSDADQAFGRTGIPNFVLEEVLAELQSLGGSYLDGMSSSFSLVLSPTKAGASNKPATEQITKLVQMRLASGEVVHRSIRQLSGGERRRFALALGLGFSELAARRGRFSCNLLVLDEVLQHLDNQGCAAVATILRSMSQDSILLIGQDNTFATESFDAIDVVTKEGGCSSVSSRGSKV